MASISPPGRRPPKFPSPPIGPPKLPGPPEGPGRPGKFKHPRPKDKKPFMKKAQEKTVGPLKKVVKSSLVKKMGLLGVDQSRLG